MTNQEYEDWRKQDPVTRRARFLRGTRSPIVIMAVPTGLPDDRRIEGFVIQSESTQYQAGYVSFGWLAEFFEFARGEISFRLLP
jgi:hypothetical protein